MADEHRPSESKISIDKPLHVIIEQKEAPPRETKDTSWFSRSGGDLLKWIFGTLVLGGLGWYTNFNYQQTELALKRMEVDSRLIDAVSTKFDTATGVQIKYLRFVEPFVTTQSLKDAIQEKLLSLSTSVNIQIRDSTEKVVTASTDKVKRALTPSQQKKVLENTSRVAPAPNTSMEVFKAKEDSALRDIVKTRFDSAAIKTIQRSKQLVIPIVAREYVLQGQPQTKWCKKNYYVEFNGNLRIGVNDIGKNSVDVDLSRIVVNDAQTIAESTVIKIGETVTQDDGDYRYQISLDYIGAGGRNPFTPAAYLTVAVYKK